MNFKSKMTNLQTNQEIDDLGIIGLNWYNKPTTYAQLMSWYQALEALILVILRYSKQTNYMRQG